MKNPHRPAGSSRRAIVSPGARAAHVIRAAGTDAGSGAWLHPALWAAVIALALYLPSVGYDFVRDDHELIRANPFLRRDGWLVQLLTSDFWRASGRNSGMWRPLVVLTYWIDGRVFHWQPWGFHTVNLILNAATSAVVAWLARAGGATRLAALLAGAWFATMPAHVENVAWISGRTDVMAALGFALALVLDRRARRAGRSWPGVLAPLVLALALVSKEAALPFVAVVAVAEWVEPRGARFDARAAARWLAPYLAVTAVFLVVHETLAARWTQPPFIDHTTAGLIRWAGWIMLPHYLAMLWPWYPHSPDIALQLPAGPLVVPVLIGIPVSLALFAFTATLAWRRAAAAVPAAVFVLPLVTMVALAWTRAYLTFAERLLYLPSIGAAWLLGLVLTTLARRGVVAARAGYTLAALLVMASAWQAWRLVPDWKDDFTMFRAMTVVQPENARARIGYANQLAARGEEQTALEQLAIAERLDPRLAETHASRAVVYFRHGDWNAVQASAQRALEIDPMNPQAQLLRATALMRLRRLDEAMPVLQRMMTQSPGDPAIEGIWGQVLLLQGDPAGAVPFLERAAQWHGDDASVSYALGVACQLTVQWAKARDAFAATVRTDPRYYEGWLRLAAAAHEAGDPATRDRALAAARALPDARDGRVGALERQLGAR